MNTDDDVIIAGKIVRVLIDGTVEIKLPSGLINVATQEDIKSYRPAVKVDGIDKRKGN